MSVTDGDGALVTQTYTVNLTGANETTRIAPTDISLTPATPADSVNFNSFVFNGTLTATDPDPGAIAFSITSQTTAGQFSITGGNQLTANGLSTNATLQIVIRATQTGDPGGMFTEETFTTQSGTNAY
jgi:hypothetical protein